MHNSKKICTFAVAKVKIHTMSDKALQELQKGVITQDNLYLLLPGKVMAVAEMYARHHDVTLLDAMRKVYASDMYKRLEREDTKYWHLGTVALYQSLA